MDTSVDSDNTMRSSPGAVSRWTSPTEHSSDQSVLRMRTESEQYFKSNKVESQSNIDCENSQRRNSASTNQVTTTTNIV